MNRPIHQILTGHSEKYRETGRPMQSWQRRGFLGARIHHAQPMKSDRHVRLPSACMISLIGTITGSNPASRTLSIVIGNPSEMIIRPSSKAMVLAAYASSSSTK